MASITTIEKSFNTEVQPLVDQCLKSDNLNKVLELSGKIKEMVQNLQHQSKGHENFQVQLSTVMPAVMDKIELLSQNIDKVEEQAMKADPVVMASLKPAPIPNQGNDCSFNSILQALANDPEMAKMLLVSKNENHPTLVRAIYAAQLSEGKGTQVNSQLLRKELKPGQKVNSQEDASESLEKILPEIGFEYKLNKLETIPGLGEITSEYKARPVLPWDIRKTQNSEAGLKDYLSSENLRFEENPSHLFIQAVRNSNGEKDDRAVRADNYLELPGDVYELTSVIYHLGNAQGGHYATLLKKLDGWYSVSDTQVRKVKDTFVRDASNQRGYIYIYRKVSTENVMSSPEVTTIKPMAQQIEITQSKQPTIGVLKKVEKPVDDEVYLDCIEEPFEEELNQEEQMEKTASGTLQIGRTLLAYGQETVRYAFGKVAGLFTRK